MLKARPSNMQSNQTENPPVFDRNTPILTKSMRLLAKLLESDWDSADIAKAISPLDISVYAMPDRNGIKDKIESMVIESIRDAHGKGNSTQNIYAMCAYIISGAAAVIACFYE